MKKYLLILILPFLFLNNVYATTLVQSIDNTEKDSNINQSTLDDIYNTLIPSKPGYHYFIQYFENINQFSVTFFGETNTLSFDTSSGNLSILIRLDSTQNYSIFTCDEVNNFSCNELQNESTFISILQLNSPLSPQYVFYDSDVPIDNFIQDVELTGFYSDSIIINQGDYFPTLKNLYQYSSWADYVTEYDENYTTVNLDDYEYVILSLKNYNQADSFQTNFSVKGQIGITPVYNFGQTSKDSITGSQVQDRCNISYSDYTLYPFYILQSDLQNNAVYYVKSCAENSSFKFDNTVFNVTYITQANSSSPTVTINGQTYNTIPYTELPSTATENEENNYIPGESGSATDVGGLDSAIKSAQQNLSTIWNTITYFTDFIGMVFSTLPLELRTVLFSAFVIIITFGVIKIFVS